MRKNTTATKGTTTPKKATATKGTTTPKKAEGVMDILQEAIYKKIYEKTKNNRLAFQEWAGACLYAMSQEEKYTDALEKIKIILKKSAEDVGESWDDVKGAENRKIRYLRKLYELKTKDIDATESPEDITEYIQKNDLSIAFVNDEHDRVFNPTKAEKPTKKDEGESLAVLVAKIEKLTSDPVMMKTFNDLLKKKVGFELVKNEKEYMKILKEA